MKAAAEKKNGLNGNCFVFLFRIMPVLSCPHFLGAQPRKIGKKKQCLPRLVSLPQRRLVRLDATAPLISFAGSTRPPGGPIDSQILPFCI